MSRLVRQQKLLFVENVFEKVAKWCNQLHRIYIFLKLEIWPNSKQIEVLSWQSHRNQVTFSAAAKNYLLSEISSKMLPASKNFIFFSTLRFDKTWRRLRWFHNRVTKVRSPIVRQQKLLFVKNFFKKVAKWCDQRQRISFFFSQIWDLTKFEGDGGDFIAVTKVRSRLMRQQFLLCAQIFFENVAKWFNQPHRFSFFLKLEIRPNSKEIEVISSQSHQSYVPFSAASKIYCLSKMSSKMWPDGVTSLKEFHFFLKLEIWPNSKQIEVISSHSHQSQVTFNAAAIFTFCSKFLRKCGQMV